MLETSKGGHDAEREGMRALPAFGMHQLALKDGPEIFDLTDTQKDSDAECPPTLPPEQSQRRAP